MAYVVTLEMVEPRLIAAVRRRVAMNEVPNSFKSALDMVWAFLGQNPGLCVDGHNIFLYHHETPAIMPVDFGVEVKRSFADAGDVHCVTTPSGEAAQVIHRGPYHLMRAAHEALHEWCAVNHRRIGRYSLEIYGDWTDDPAKLETTIQYLLM